MRNGADFRAQISCLEGDTMKKYPYCFTELDDRASICSGCRKKIDRRGKNGIAKTHSPGFYQQFCL